MCVGMQQDVATGQAFLEQLQGALTANRGLRLQSQGWLAVA